MQQSFSLNNFVIRPSASNPGNGVSEVVLLSHRRGKKLNKTTQNNKKPHKVSQVQMQYSFSKFFSMQLYFSCCLIKGREKKKESGDSSMNGYLRLWLTCPLLSACYAGGFIYADLRMILALT
jgi:hypothetical protein